MKARTALSVIALVGMMALASIAAGGDSPDSGLLGRWSFDEGKGVYSANAADPTGDAELHQASWAKGEFGTALRLTGSDSYVILPAMPKLAGSDEMSLAVWVYWEGTGRYPNVLTGGTWSPGGFLIFVSDRACSFRMGRPGHRHGTAGETWTEASAPFLSELPMKQWVHLAAVFKRPQITTYVNGKKAGSARWGLSGRAKRRSPVRALVWIDQPRRLDRRTADLSSDTRGRRGAGLGQSGGTPNGRLQGPGPCQNRGQGTRPL